MPGLCQVLHKWWLLVLLFDASLTWAFGIFFGIDWLPNWQYKQMRQVYYSISFCPEGPEARTELLLHQSLAGACDITAH